jgi:predicted small metal-binding protein
MRGRQVNMALQVACDTAVNGCVFLMRSEDDDKERLLKAAQEHVKEQHGKDFTLEEIEERYVEEVDVPGMKA